MSIEDNRRFLSRQELFKEQISANELTVLKQMIVGLDGKKYDGLRGVRWAMFLAGDFADSFDHSQVFPEHIDLRIALDAPRGSDVQKVKLGRMESALYTYLASSDLPYVQRAGDDWYLVRMSYEKDCHEYLRHPDKPHKNIRFTIIPSEDDARRRIDIVINRFRGKNIEDQLKWEELERQREPIILFDSEYPKSCIL